MEQVSNTDYYQDSNYDSTTYSWKLEKIIELKKDDSLIIRPNFQRGFVWPEDYQQKFLESLFNGIPIPPIIINYVKTREGKIIKEKYRCVDGQQRLTTICKFMENEISYKVKNDKEKNDNIYINLWYSEIPGKYKNEKYIYRDRHKLLSESDRINIKNKSIPFVQYKDLSEIDERRFFSILQLTQTISVDELLHNLEGVYESGSIIGEIAKVCNELNKEENYFKLSKTNTVTAYYHLAFILMQYIFYDGTKKVNSIVSFDKIKDINLLDDPNFVKCCNKNKEKLISAINSSYTQLNEDKKVITNKEKLAQYIIQNLNISFESEINFNRIPELTSDRIDSFINETKNCNTVSSITEIIKRIRTEMNYIGVVCQYLPSKITKDKIDIVKEDVILFLEKVKKHQSL